MSALEKGCSEYGYFEELVSAARETLGGSLPVNDFSFSHAKLFPGTEHTGCLFIPFCCLLLALLSVALLLTSRPKIKGGDVTTVTHYFVYE